MRKQDSAAPPITAPPHDVRPNRKLIYNSAKRHSNTVNNTNAKRGRPRGRGLATLQIPFPAHGSSNATNLRRRSPSRRWHAGRATSMRPTESVGSRRRTRMRTGESGARAPDRNRGRPPRMPPPRGTTHEEQSTRPNDQPIKESKHSPNSIPSLMRQLQPSRQRPISMLSRQSRQKHHFH